MPSNMLQAKISSIARMSNLQRSANKIGLADIRGVDKEITSRTGYPESKTALRYSSLYVQARDRSRWLSGCVEPKALRVINECGRWMDLYMCNTL